MSNGDWGVKRTELTKHSALRLNAEVIQCETWNEETIQERAKNLATVATRVWSRPV